jgi:hypothetical protein
MLRKALNKSSEITFSSTGHEHLDRVINEWFVDLQRRLLEKAWEFSFLLFGLDQNQKLFYSKQFLSEQKGWIKKRLGDLRHDRTIPRRDVIANELEIILKNNAVKFITNIPNTEIHDTIYFWHLSKIHKGLGKAVNTIEDWQKKSDDLFRKDSAAALQSKKAWEHHEIRVNDTSHSLALFVESAKPALVIVMIIASFLNIPRILNGGLFEILCLFAALVSITLMTFPYYKLYNPRTNTKNNTLEKSVDIDQMKEDAFDAIFKKFNSLSHTSSPTVEEQKKVSTSAPLPAPAKQPEPEPSAKPKEKIKTHGKSDPARSDEKSNNKTQESTAMLIELFGAIPNGTAYAEVDRKLVLDAFPKKADEDLAAKFIKVVDLKQGHGGRVLPPSDRGHEGFKKANKLFNGVLCKLKIKIFDDPENPKAGNARLYLTEKYKTAHGKPVFVPYVVSLEDHARKKRA